MLEGYMMANPDQALLDDLLAEVEAAWIGRRDATVVDRLAAQHPQHAEELYEFFAELFFAERGDNVPTGLEDALGESLDRWFEERGRHIANEAVEAARSAEASTPPEPSPVTDAAASAPPSPTPSGGEGARASARPFLTLVEETTGLEAEEIAERLGDLTAEFLLFTERYPELYPFPVRRELGRRTQRLFGIPVEEVILAFEYRPEIRIAASRSRGYTGRPASFEELLRRAGLSFEQQRYWTNLARGG
jgi:hypothetical protein